jgi:hypothetical protein
MRTAAAPWWQNFVRGPRFPAATRNCRSNRPGIEGLPEFGRRQIDFGGIQDGSVAIVAQLFMALDDAAPKPWTVPSGLVHVDQDAVGGRYSNKCEVRSKNSGRKNSTPPGA